MSRTFALLDDNDHASVLGFVTLDPLPRQSSTDAAQYPALLNIEDGPAAGFYQRGNSVGMSAAAGPWGAVTAYYMRAAATRVDASSVRRQP